MCISAPQHIVFWAFRVYTPLACIPNIQLPALAQEPGIGHCNFTPEKDYSEILITWHREMRLRPVLVGFFQIWIDRAEVGG